ncbi:MAG: hypothetical protein FJX66_04170 [Alphaproteobacteria bacterium]|nr:hypothetical protein [Alphaproteobacteria bacterium]
MSHRPITYAQLLETNNLLQVFTDESYWLCVTRTVQESKLFPVPAYMMLSYLNAFYRYPSLLRKVESRMKAEEIGDRARNMGIKINNPPMSWGLLGFYFLGREWLINMGLLRPQDAVEDIVYVMDFWKRFQLSWHRNDGHITNKEFGHRAQVLPERRLQVFHADMYRCEAGDELHTAAANFMATVSQYGFLISCESRISLCNTGPYKIDDKREMIVRDFMDLAENDLPWLDGVAADMPYNNLTVPMMVKDCHFYLMDDWGSFESKPDFRAEHIAGVGLYTSDPLTEGFVPVGMGSKAELIRTYNDLAGKAKEATNRLWKRIAGWTRDQMIDAGALMYFGIFKDIAHVAGTYEYEDWMLIDERAQRFRPLLNDEFSRDVLAELVGYVSQPSQTVHDYTMMQHNNGPRRMFTPIPFSILMGDDYTLTSGPVYPGSTCLPKKEDRYRTSRGQMTLAEYNNAVRSFTPVACRNENRFLDETWLKYNAKSEAARALYENEQALSRKLKGKGAGLSRADVEALADKS